MAPWTPPAEGITIEYLIRGFRTIALQPIITGAALAASLRSPDYVARILSVLSRGKLTLGTFRRITRVLLAIAVSYRLNNLLNRLVLNNWTTDRTWDWRKEIVIVTGGCSGIGELIANRLSQENVKVVILDVSPPRNALPSSTWFYQTDITSSQEIAETARQIRKDVGNPTVLINNAGISKPVPFLHKTENEIRAAFDVNTISHFLLTKEFLPYMIEKNHGHVVTIASLSSFVAHASSIDYGCTKAAALAFHEGLAQEVKYRYNANKVRTTVVHPTFVRTPLIDQLTREKSWKQFTIEPITVANVVVTQVLKGESAQLILPGRYTALSLLRGTSSWFQEGIRNAGKDVLPKS